MAGAIGAEVSPEEAGSGAQLKTRLLVVAILGELSEDGPRASNLADSIEGLAGALADPALVVDCVGRIRQALLAEGWFRRERVDAVVDRVLAGAVAYMFADLQHQALTDPLTGLGNRRALGRDLDLEVARTIRTGSPLSVVMLDVDRLKDVNDSQGHDAGDDALRRIGLALDAACRRSDRAYRYGGDEFVLLMSDAVITDGAAVQKRLLDKGAPPCSLGVASSTTDPIDALLSLADRRLYAGRHGRAPRLG
jgi:diguanylate cyclase (GGDEF)-like protein